MYRKARKLGNFRYYIRCGEGLVEGEDQAFVVEGDVGEDFEGFGEEAFVVSIARGVVAGEEAFRSSLFGYHGSLAGGGVETVLGIGLVTVEVGCLVEKEINRSYLFRQRRHIDSVADVRV